jgi:signal transduction histidine kinase
MAAASALLVLVLGLFAVALARSHSDDRRQAERRFEERSRISAALTQSLFASTATQAAAQNARRFGDKVVDRRRLERQLRDSSLAYAVVLDSRGRVLAASRSVPPAVRARLAGRPASIRRALVGRTFLSDFTDVRGTPGVLEFSAAFKTRFGTRVIVQGFSANLISHFVGSYLGSIPDARRSTAYVLDSHGRVVGSPNPHQPGGSRVREPGLVAALRGAARTGEFRSKGTARSFASAPVGGTTWRVVLSTRSRTLYEGTNPLVQWLVLFALAAAGAAAVLLFRRALRAAVTVEQTNARLEIANAELARTNAELARTNVELARSNAELEQFASVASHDLQEPLRKVQSFGDQLEHRFAAELPSEALDYLRRMRSSANRMSNLIDDLLTFSRVGTRPQAMQLVDLADVAREVVAADLDGLIHDTHGSVSIGALGSIEADALQMRQLLQNLIANGLKFHRPQLSAVVRVEPIDCEQPGCVAFAVSDNGIGFDARYAQRIFRVFERLHPRDVYAGTGIGLALCRRIVERHGGEISAEGKDGEGARFTVTLPRSASAQRRAAGRDRREAVSPNGDEARVPAHV